MNVTNDKISKTTLACLLIVMAMPVIVYGQTRDWDKPTITKSEIIGPEPSATAYIVKDFIDKADTNSDYETGSIHIVYSDGTDVVEKLPPKEKSTEKLTGGKPRRFYRPQSVWQ